MISFLKPLYSSVDCICGCSNQYFSRNLTSGATYTVFFHPRTLSNGDLEGARRILQGQGYSYGNRLVWPRSLRSTGPPQRLRNANRRDAGRLAGADRGGAWTCRLHRL